MPYLEFHQFILADYEIIWARTKFIHGIQENLKEILLRLLENLLIIKSIDSGLKKDPEGEFRDELIKMAKVDINELALFNDVFTKLGLKITW